MKHMLVAMIALPMMAQTKTEPVSLVVHQEHASAIIALANAYEQKMAAKRADEKADADIQVAAKAIQASIAKARKECEDKKKSLDTSRQQDGVLACVDTPNPEKPKEPK